MEFDFFQEKLIAVKKLIAKNRIDDALSESRGLFQNSPRLVEELDAISSMFDANEKKHLTNLITYEEYSVQRNKIVQYYLDLFKRKPIDQKCSEKALMKSKAVYDEPISIDYVDKEKYLNFPDYDLEESFLLRMLVLDKDYHVRTKKYMEVRELAAILGTKLFPHLQDQKYRWSFNYSPQNRKPFEREELINEYLCIYQAINSASTILQLKGKYIYPQTIGFNSSSQEYSLGISME